MDKNNAANAGTFKFDDNFIVNRLGYGTMQLTGKGVWGPYKDPDHAVDLIKNAFDLGVNFIDTADSYGPWTADSYLAKALKEYSDSDKIFISDKVGQVRTGENEWTPVGVPAFLRQEVELSLRMFHRDHEDLLFLHRIDSHVPIEDQVGELKKMQDEGKIKHIGISQVSLDELKAAQKIAKIDAVENMYNVGHHKDDDGIVDYAEENNIAFLPWFPLDTGNLAKTNSPLEDIAKKYNASPAQIALAWLLKRSKNIIPIPGTSSLDHLKDNLNAANVNLSSEDFEKLSSLQK
ncbi:aldo/keto reductase [Companilactobacillus alimentarius]|uniref:Aldo/keto reductase n=1 Tax=Companilactobacillus alimentarius DSM 20249 TaxID=1423720 RepID=A0A2K9HR63_9LACO|nr:aldo/keto reductase [Companilactobacillus alimentarius]AUI72282.1 aldo/keto reductase [Companilactobacillus alimentarius DSM 20249]KRK77493.1 NADP-dependent oxidoreductase domain-containing protein [Companilactobacillus alimentarius DSM 20249]MDT6952857.1 aldo/keto reductase [Companilactobacillus alimentarius]GEO45508.1 aldo/keto reductase [Companilactobacillus alimentarius]